MFRMTRAEDLRIKLLVKEAVREEMDEFYRKLAVLLEQVSSGGMSPTLQKILELLENEELTADQIASKRGTSRSTRRFGS